MTPIEITELLLVGLLAGSLGGLLGIGGSIVMIPALGVILDRNQHLAQASAMIVNVFIAVPSLRQHWKAGAVRWDVAWRMLPFGLVLILVGVELSNQLNGDMLKGVFGVFLLYVIFTNVMKIVANTGEPEHHEQRTGWPQTGVVGSVMGFMAGLLGIGGGGIAVPLLQRVCNLPLRQCIATSSAVMCITAVVGAVRKNVALDTLNGGSLTVEDSLAIAACLAPTAIIGGLIGGWLTHKLPLKAVRIAFVVLMCGACASMLGLL